METTNEHQKENLHEALLSESSGAEALPTPELPTTSETSASGSWLNDRKENKDLTDQSAFDPHSSLENKKMCQSLIRSTSFTKPTRASQINIEMDTIVTVEVNQQSRPDRDSRSVSTSVLSTASDGAICRICHDGEEDEDLLSPCHCTGTVGLLHLSCLEKWLGSSSRTRCELCGFEYTVDSQPKPFMEWLRHPASLSDRRNMICDVCCFFLLTPLAIISSWLCLVGAQYYSYWTGRWEVPGLVSLTVFLICIYVTWCLVVVRYHYRIWLEWRRHNQIVRIRAVRRGNVVRRNMTLSTGSQLLSSDSNLRSRTSPTQEPQAEDNNNNNAAVVGMETEEEEEDVVVEVTGGSGQRGSYRLLSDSSNLVCSPNKLLRHRHSSSSSQRSKLHSIGFSPPGRPNQKRSSTSSAEGEITAPLLGGASGGEPSRGRHCVSRSLMLDPGFSESQSVSVHSTMVTYQQITDDVFTTLTDRDRFSRKTDRIKESYV